MNYENLIKKIAEQKTSYTESPRDRHRREVFDELFAGVRDGGLGSILTNGNITGRTRFLRLKYMKIIDGRQVISGKWVYTNSADKLLVYMTEVALRAYLCNVLNIPFEESLNTSLIGLVTRYEISGGDHKAVCMLENLVFDEYDMVSSPDNASEKQVLAFISRFNEAVKTVVRDKKVQFAVLIDYSKTMPESLAESLLPKKKTTKVQSA